MPLCHRRRCRQVLEVVSAQLEDEWMFTGLVCKALRVSNHVCCLLHLRPEYGVFARKETQHHPAMRIRVALHWRNVKMWRLDERYNHILYSSSWMGNSKQYSAPRTATSGYRGTVRGWGDYSEYGNAKRRGGVKIEDIHTRFQDVRFFARSSRTKHSRSPLLLYLLTLLMTASVRADRR